MRKNLRKKSLNLILVFVVVFCTLFSSTALAATESSAADNGSLDYLKSIMDMIKEKYNGQVNDSDLIKAAVDGMLNSLDPYTTFFTPEEADSFLSSIEGTYVGIGISMELSGDYVVVSKVFAASPAERAGILQGDRIAQINGESAVGKSLEKVASLVTGEEGTSVKLGIIRSGSSGILNLTVKRETIKVNPVTYDIRNGIGYIKLEMFNSNTDEYLTQALNEMDKNKITKIILDLRDNPGGEVDQAVKLAQKFVPSGLITKLDFKSEEYTDEEYYSYLSSEKYKLAVLVNENSASASEIVAGAIQDTQAGTLIGTKTFGKAKVQGLIPILTPEATAKYEAQLGVSITDASDLQYKYGITPLESEIMGYTKMTLGFYYTPKGKMIDEIGITPDIEVANPSPVSGININSVEKLTLSVKAKLNSQGIDVYNAEKMLKVLGYDVNTPDTVLDTKTSAAIKKFQKDSKLYAYGDLDFATQKALNEAFDNILLVDDKQYAKAVEILGK